MLLLKRLVTAFGLFIVLFIILYVGTLAVMGGIAGAQVAAHNNAPGDFQSGYRAGAEAGRQIGQKWGPLVAYITLGVSAILSVSLSFGGILPWCKAPSEANRLPPPL